MQPQGADFSDGAGLTSRLGMQFSGYPCEWLNWPCRLWLVAMQNNVPVEGTHGVAGPSRWLVLLAFGTVYLVWGSTYLAIKLMVETIPPFLGAGLRFLVAGAILAAWLLVKNGPQSLRFIRFQVKPLVLTSLLLIVGGPGMTTAAEQYIPSNLAALIAASVPIWVLLWGFLAGNRLNRGAWYAMLTGFLGVGLLVLPRLVAPWAGSSSDVIWLGVLLMLVAPLSYSLGSFLSSRLALPPGILATSAYQMLLGGAVLTGISALMGELDGPSVQVSAVSAWSLVYLIVPGSVLAFTAYAWLLRHVPVHQAATFAYVNPLIAVALGWLILAEPLSWSTLPGAVLILGAVIYAVTPRRHFAPARGHQNERSHQD